MSAGLDGPRNGANTLLTRELASEFESRIRARGETYARNGKVSIHTVRDRDVSAVVAGTRPYEVRIWSEDGESDLNMACECPHFQRGFLCKHLWATLVEMEQAGILMSDGLPEPRRHAPSAEPAFPEDGDDILGFLSSLMPELPLAARPSARRSHQLEPWRAVLNEVQFLERESARISLWPPGQELLYLLNIPNTLRGEGLTIGACTRKPKKNGDWGKVKPYIASPVNSEEAIPGPLDRSIVALMKGAVSVQYGYRRQLDRCVISNALQETLLPMLCRTGRFYLDNNGESLGPLTLDEGPPWKLEIDVSHKSSRRYQVRCHLSRGTDQMDLAEPQLLLASGWLFTGRSAARLDHFGAFPWIGILRQEDNIHVPTKHGPDFLEKLLSCRRIPPLNLPDELQYEEISPNPQMRLTLRPAKSSTDAKWLEAELLFDYDGELFPERTEEPGRFLPDRRLFVRRNEAAEQAAARRLKDLAFWERGGPTFHYRELLARHLPRVVDELIREGWHVEAEGKPFRQAGGFALNVTSGIDWFDLEACAEFGDVAVSLPELLEAAAKGTTTVILNDGSLGIVPQEWLKKLNLLTGFGAIDGRRVRFKRSQAALLDALLAVQPKVSVDDTFAQARARLRQFERVEPADPPAGFSGTLRDYQRDGLGWLHFLRAFGLGGCLADDMGLGKTVQMLALLESRRHDRQSRPPSDPERPGPSLAVVPRSVLGNWRQEAARFTPGLRVLDHTGLGRTQGPDGFAECDLVLTTYGTLRRDAAFLKDVSFDYVVLDEAQTIKNHRTATAKAARLLQAGQRIALSGTPVENHINDLWSLMEFLNPGMLGSASLSKIVVGLDGSVGEEAREVLARALRPVILRRTKDQVAPELPPKVEQTITCELQGTQRRQYDELRDHYRASVLQSIDANGMGRSKMHVLEALLRLRQAACHPGLIDKSKAARSSAKLEALVPLLTEVTDEDHKALVFSQFTSFLAIVRDRLDHAGIPYTYLDGRTRKRSERIEQFQNDPDCKLFLISLKAGGLGLNLTAAEYVYLLDPWWNPAVEAQAIDRTHRIGQIHPVFAYRLIAQDTVEEKILELQDRKRELADAIIRADNKLIRNLTREDIELLLS